MPRSPELGDDDLSVLLAGDHQLLVGPGADDGAIVQDDDPVGVEDGAHPLGDDHHRGVARLPAELRAQPRVGGGVQGREAIVEEVDERPLDDGPGDRQPLALAT